MIAPDKNDFPKLDVFPTFNVGGLGGQAHRKFFLRTASPQFQAIQSAKMIEVVRFPSLGVVEIGDFLHAYLATGNFAGRAGQNLPTPGIHICGLIHPLSSLLDHDAALSI